MWLHKSEWMDITRPVFKCDRGFGCTADLKDSKSFLIGSVNNLYTQETNTPMDIQNIRGRRRSARNRTIVIDPRDLQDDDRPQFTDIPVTQHQTGPIHGRTFAFFDLMTAFKDIEKRSVSDPRTIQNILKKFKTNDEQAIEISNEEQKMRIEIEIFPQIMNNPFIRNDSDVPLDRIEKEQKRHYSQNQRFR